MKGQFLLFMFQPEIQRYGILLFMDGFTYNHCMSVNAEFVDQYSFANVFRKILEAVMISSEIALEYSCYLDTNNIEKLKSNL